VRDLNIPLALQENFGHVNTGIYADVLDEGTVHIGDALILPR
jgi:MOSC domain-containing protein YiiM